MTDIATTDARGTFGASGNFGTFPRQGSVCANCERRPLRTSDVITRDGKKIAVWSYGSSYLHMADDKLIHIFGP